MVIKVAIAGTGTEATECEDRVPDTLWVFL
jgi:hypothetical protein